jgi:chorismate mutase
VNDAEIDELRKRIDELDKEILERVAERIRIVLAIGDWKRKHGVPVYDAERERRIFERLSALASPPLDGDTIRRIFERLIDESRRIEHQHVHDE